MSRIHDEIKANPSRAIEIFDAIFGELPPLASMDDLLDCTATVSREAVRVMLLAGLGCYPTEIAEMEDLSATKVQNILKKYDGKFFGLVAARKRRMKVRKFTQSGLSPNVIAAQLNVPVAVVEHDLTRPIPPIRAPRDASPLPKRTPHIADEAEYAAGLAEFAKLENERFRRITQAGVM